MTIYEVLGRKTEEAENWRQQVGIALDVLRQIKAGMITPDQIQIDEHGAVSISPQTK